MNIQTINKMAMNPVTMFRMIRGLPKRSSRRRKTRTESLTSATATAWRTVAIYMSWIAVSFPQQESEEDSTFNASSKCRENLINHAG